jgi:hypothetical protein
MLLQNLEKWGGEAKHQEEHDTLSADGKQIPHAHGSNV